MSDVHEWHSVAAAIVRRYEAEQDDPWHLDALRISRQLLALLDRPAVARGELAPLLVEAGRLPAREGGATVLRRALIRSYLAVEAVGFQPPPVHPGELVIDDSGEVCLVTAPCATPAAKWLAEQEFEGVRSMASARWWEAYPLLNGGLALLAEPLVFAVGRPHADQLWDLLAFLKVPQVRTLLSLFPEVAARVKR